MRKKLKFLFCSSCPQKMIDEKRNAKKMSIGLGIDPNHLHFLVLEYTYSTLLSLRPGRYLSFCWPALKFRKRTLKEENKNDLLGGWLTPQQQ